LRIPRPPNTHKNDVSGRKVASSEMYAHVCIWTQTVRRVFVRARRLKLAEVFLKQLHHNTNRCWQVDRRGVFRDFWPERTDLCTHISTRRPCSGVHITLCTRYFGRTSVAHRNEVSADYSSKLFRMLSDAADGFGRVRRGLKQPVRGRGSRNVRRFARPDFSAVRRRHANTRDGIIITLFNKKNKWITFDETGRARFLYGDFFLFFLYTRLSGFTRSVDI